MTFGLLNLIPTRAVDVVGVYDENFKQVFTEGRPVKATINDDATFFKHPLENSDQRTDHIIFNPVEINLTLILAGREARTAFATIKQAYANQTKLIVKTRADTYDDLYVKAMPHDESPDSYDAVVINLILEETRIAGADVSFKPLNSSDSNTVRRGQQRTKTPTDKQESRASTLARLFS